MLSTLPIPLHIHQGIFYFEIYLKNEWVFYYHNFFLIASFPIENMFVLDWITGQKFPRVSIAASVHAVYILAVYFGWPIRDMIMDMAIGQEIALAAVCIWPLVNYFTPKTGVIWVINSQIKNFFKINKLD